MKIQFSNLDNVDLNITGPAKPEFAKLRLWEYDYETIAGKLICEFGFKGDKAIKAIMGAWVWEAFTKKFRASFLRRLRDLGVEYRLMKLKGSKTKVLIIGADRIKIAEGLNALSRRRVITTEQRSDYMLRLARGEFPNRDLEHEVALEFDLLLAE